jgi:MerR family transcriptional regulator, copper efflux regulator
MSTSERYHLTLVGSSAGSSVGGISLGASEPRSAEAGEGVDVPLLQVGDLARLTGKTVRAIHHYEELGLIEPVGRSKGHYRLFEREALVRIRWIHKLQALGLSLAEIRTLVRNRHGSASAQQSADQLRRTYEAKLVEVRARVAELTALQHELEASLAYLDSCNTSCAAELAPTDCAQCDRHPETEETDLISGAMV